MILVCGISGQLGQELKLLARQLGTPVRGLRRSDLDIADPHKVPKMISSVRPSVIVNVAAFTDVDGAEVSEAAAIRANVEGPRTLATSAAHHGIPLVHISTDYVFDGTKQGAYKEDDPTCPLGVYGRTKLAGEVAIRENLLHHVIVRTSWLYSARGRNFLKAILRLADTRDELRIVADQVGSPTWARDLAGAVLKMAPMLAADNGLSGTYHYSGLGSTSWYGFGERILAARALIAKTNPRLLPISTAEYPTLARRPANSVLDCSKFTERFGFGPQPWDGGVDKSVAETYSEAGLR